MGGTHRGRGAVKRVPQASAIRGFATRQFYANETLDPESGSHKNDRFDDNELRNLIAIAEPMVECVVLRG